MRHRLTLKSLQWGMVLLLSGFWSSCRTDFEFTPDVSSLSFSKDTVYLDTIFSNIGSSTYNLKLYNQSSENILISSLKLGQGENSFYRLSVDGMNGNAGKIFENVELLAKDSMYIFIETTVDIQSLTNGNQFLYTDHIAFESRGIEKKVDLVTLVKDAVFIYPQRFPNTAEGGYIYETLSFDADGDGSVDETNLQGRFLTDDELIFTNDKPYVIYGFAGVNQNKTLEVQAGARIHFHANSGLIVTPGGSIQVNGSLSSDAELMEQAVIFEGDRLEPDFDDVPGQWETIWLFEGSTNNYFNHTIIKNGTIGLLSDGNANDSNKLILENTQFYNHSNFGILARASSVRGENLVINNVGQSSFAGTIGGNYSFTHSTFANYWNNSFRQFPTVLLNNFAVDSDNNTMTNPLESAIFTNCIIYGSNNNELLLDEAQGAEFNFYFDHCLLRYENSSTSLGANYDFQNAQLYNSLIRNANPLFENPSHNKLRIPNNSLANGVGIVSGLLTQDILGVSRGIMPDLGAYESQDF
jgi:hypothetical protein